MQISTSLFYDRSNSQLASLNQAADTLQTQISTGKKLAAPSDDVIAYQRLQGLARAGADDSAYAANVSIAKTVLQQGDTALSSVVTQIQRAQELAIKANSGTLSAGDLQAVSTELKSIVQTLSSLANSKDTRGGALFGGAEGGDPVTVAADGSVSINNTGAPAAIPIGDDQSIQTNETADRVFGGVPTASGTSDVFSIISTLASALDASASAGPAATSAAAGAASDGLQAALDQVTGVQTSVGAREARLTLVSGALTDAATTRETTRSSLEDTDLTTAITQLQKTMTILQATQASFTKLSSLSLFDYLK